MNRLLDIIKIKDNPLSKSEIVELADVVYGGSLLKMFSEYRLRLHEAIIIENRYQVLLYRRELNLIRTMLREEIK